MIVLKIEHQEGLLHVELAAATEMFFDLDYHGIDYEQLLRDVCIVAPALMDTDADLMEMYEGVRGAGPKRTNMDIITGFLTVYLSQIRATNIDIGAFNTVPARGL